MKKNIWMRVIAILMTNVMLLTSGQMAWAMDEVEYFSTDYGWNGSDCFVCYWRRMQDFVVTGQDAELELQISWDHVMEYTTVQHTSNEELLIFEFGAPLPQNVFVDLGGDFLAESQLEMSADRTKARVLIQYHQNAYDHIDMNTYLHYHGMDYDQLSDYGFLESIAPINVELNDVPYRLGPDGYPIPISDSFVNYRIMINQTSGGTITADKEEAISGDVVNLTAEPDVGKELQEISVNNGGVTVEQSSDGSYYFIMPEEEVSVEAEWESKSYAVNVFQSFGGTIVIDSDTAKYDDLVYMSIQPDEGKELQGILVNEGSVDVVYNDDGTCYFIMPAGDVAITVYWADVATDDDFWDWSDCYTVWYDSNVNYTDNGIRVQLNVHAWHDAKLSSASHNSNCQYIIIDFNQPIPPEITEVLLDNMYGEFSADRRRVRVQLYNYQNAVDEIDRVYFLDLFGEYLNQEIAQMLSDVVRPVSIAINDEPFRMESGDPTYLPDLNITTQPVSCKQIAGAKVHFSLEAEGEGLTYQWQFRRPGSSTWTNAGYYNAKTENLTFVQNEGRSKNTYRCVVTDAYGQIVESDEVNAILATGPIIVEQPVSVKALLNTAVSFAIEAEGEGLTYQWQFQKPGKTTWTNSGLASAKKATLKFKTAEKDADKKFRCIVTDTDGFSVISEEATLTIVDSPAITKQPEDVEAALGDVVYFNITATGNGLTYQWQYQAPGKTTWTNSSLAGNKKDRLRVTATESRNGGKYRCVVVDEEGVVVTSNAGMLTVV